MIFYKNNENTAILQIIKISKDCHGRSTTNYTNKNSYQVIQFIEQRDTILQHPFQIFEIFEPYVIRPMLLKVLWRSGVIL